MQNHYLCDSHQKLLLEFIIAYFYSRKHLYYNNHLTTSSNTTNNTEHELTNADKSIDNVSPEIVTLSNHCTQLRSEHDQTKSTFESMISQINETKKSSNEINEKVNKYEESQREIEKEVDNTKILYSLLKTLSLDIDGTITFGFTRNYDEMKLPFSIYSPIFKTSPYGYPFVLRLCSTIEPDNENQGYLSIYITLLRGEYDSILIYPFPYNISFCLCDQSGQKKDIISILNADSNSSSLNRPISERNNEVGITKFCPLNYLTNNQSIYLKDGVFFVRIFADFMDANQIPFT
jgi:hypothetical protein